ncbi:MAG: hypothetical protein ACXABY_16470 [Candidatus Thorarchaeota archaeon]|jgi:hypothetical protein
MDFIVSWMFVWLAITVLAGAYAIFSQVSRMKRLMDGGLEFAGSLAKGDDLKTSTKNATSTMTSGLGLTVFAAFAASISGLLFVVACLGALLG